MQIITAIMTVWHSPILAVILSYLFGVIYLCLFICRPSWMKPLTRGVYVWSVLKCELDCIVKGVQLLLFACHFQSTMEFDMDGLLSFNPCYSFLVLMLFYFFVLFLQERCALAKDSAASYGCRS